MTTPAPPLPHGDLKATLEELLGSGPTSNPALDRLLDDDATYHAVAPLTVTMLFG